jgi:hypothetical protein
MSQKDEHSTVAHFAQHAPKPGAVQIQAVTLYELGLRFDALRELYDERAVRAASAWLAADAKECAPGETDREALFELANILLLDVVDSPSEK